MGTITLSTGTHDRLRLVAAAWGQTEADAVSELLDRLAETTPLSAHGSGQDGSEAVQIHAIYQGTRVEGTFDDQTKSVTVSSGDLAGTTYKSPSRAAIEVVRHLNPTISPNRNGWGFWIITSTGERLQALRHRRRP